MKIAIVEQPGFIYRRQPICSFIKKNLRHSEIFCDNLQGLKDLTQYDLMCFITYQPFYKISKKDRQYLPPHLILEGGFFRSSVSKKHRLYSLAWGGINGLGRYYLDQYDNNRMPLIQKMSGIDIKFATGSSKYILILGQNPVDILLLDRGIDYVKWLHRTCEELKDTTNKPIYYRHSPFTRQHKRCKVPSYVKELGSDERLESHIANASATIAFSSSAGIYSLAQGVPHVSCNEASVVYDVTTHTLEDIENKPIVPIEIVQDKINQLSYQCWTLKEIADGGPSYLITNGLSPELARARKPL